MHARKNKEGGNQMKDNELLFDRKSHVLYSKPCNCLLYTSDAADEL